MATKYMKLQHQLIKAHFQSQSVRNFNQYGDKASKIYISREQESQDQALLLSSESHRIGGRIVMGWNKLRSGWKGGGGITNRNRRCFINLAIFVILLSFGYVVISLEATANEWKNVNKNKNLLLTPFINSGNANHGRELAKVENLFPNIESYSGFLTVDEECKSHLFFWFFPASSGNASAPLILWHGGGPGTSAMFGLFQGTGPVLLNEEGDQWTENKFPLTQNRSVLYLDSPVGAGFSFSEVGYICYSNSSDDVAAGAIEALRQFYILFPEYQKSDLYIASSSYGGKFLPLIAWRIDNDNQLDSLNKRSDLTSINLKGLISISGFSDPIHQIDYGEFYHSQGLIDGTQLKHFLGQEAMGKSYIRNKKYYEAYAVVDPLIVGFEGSPSYLKNVTEIEYPYNFVKDLTEGRSSEFLHRHNNFLNQPEVHKAIHVHLASTFKDRFESSSDAVYSNLVSDLYTSVGETVEDLLNSGKYKFLFTSGQFDLIVPHTTVLKFLDELRWDGQWDFKEKGLSPWTCRGNEAEGEEKVMGHGKKLDNLTYIMFRNAGHHPFIDQPQCTQNVLLKFTE